VHLPDEDFGRLDCGDALAADGRESHRVAFRLRQCEFPAGRRAGAGPGAVAFGYQLSEAATSS